MGAADKSRFARNLGQVNARDVPGFVEDVLRMWIHRRHRFSSFAAYIDAEGENDIRIICERYRQASRSSPQPDHFVDWEAAAPFSLEGRREGECSAGLAT